MNLERSTAGRIALGLILLGNAVMAMLFFQGQSREVAAAANVLRAAGSDHRAPTIAAAVALSVSQTQVAELLAEAALRDALTVIPARGSELYAKALLDASLPAYPVPYPSAAGDYASVFLSNQTFLERVRAGRVDAVAPDLLRLEILASQDVAMRALSGDPGSVSLRRLSVLLTELDSSAMSPPQTGGS